MEILKGHTSPETAYIVEDYPYGYKLRCKIRYWIEFKPKKGFRFCSQTTNPKRGHVWNKPKCCTYAEFGACMYLDDNAHVQCTYLGQYSSGVEATNWSNTYRSGVPEAGLSTLDAWVAAKSTYDANRNPGDPLSTGLVEAHKAWLDVTIKEFKPEGESNE